MELNQSEAITLQCLIDNVGVDTGQPETARKLVFEAFDSDFVRDAILDYLADLESYSDESEAE